jgi:hypothetical protein
MEYMLSDLTEKGQGVENPEATSLWRKGFA